MAPSTTGREGRPSPRQPGARNSAGAGTRAAKSGKAGSRAKTTKPRSPTARDIEIDRDVLEFIDAIDRFRKDAGKPFPTWSEVFHVLRALGYRKVAE